MPPMPIFSHKKKTLTMSGKCLNNSRKLSYLLHYLPKHLLADPVDSRFAAVHKCGAFLQRIFLVPQIKKLFFSRSEIAFPTEIFSFFSIEIRYYILRHSLLLPFRRSSLLAVLLTPALGHLGLCHFPESPLS